MMCERKESKRAVLLSAKIEKVIGISEGKI